MTAVKYLHHTPGRLRIKCQHFQCHSDLSRKAVAALEALPGVEEVRLNPRAGSLTVHYDPALRSQTELLASLEHLGCLHLAADVQTCAQARPGIPRESVSSLFGKALVGALAQRTATKLIGALL